MKGEKVAKNGYVYSLFGRKLDVDDAEELAEHLIEFVRSEGRPCPCSSCAKKRNYDKKIRTEAETTRQLSAEEQEDHDRMIADINEGI